MLPFCSYTAHAIEGDMEGFIADDNRMRVYKVVDRTTEEVVCWTPRVPKMDLEEGGAWGWFMIRDGLKEPRS